MFIYLNLKTMTHCKEICKSRRLSVPYNFIFLYVLGIFSYLAQFYRSTKARKMCKYALNVFNRLLDRVLRSEALPKFVRIYFWNHTCLQGICTACFILNRIESIVLVTGPKGQICRMCDIVYIFTYYWLLEADRVVFNEHTYKFFILFVFYVFWYVTISGNQLINSNKTKLTQTQ